ncbi:MULTISPECIES: GNAT family N-acetyltransferase [unclassified Streptomyces]|uniref:GNAT family N-acetyltransferase n=1 Tax=unclassified Streptomyces TaxID=2593676 RepID=UPI002E16033A|nr:GNAT family N-acetyltransferase [Streptomyces sp. NBC_01207]WTA20181.1 GNAT family N-acetyltransferase [Streptomyces sp. NBC_00853]
MAEPESCIRRHTALTSDLRSAITEVYAEVRADLLVHPNYRVDVFLERLDRHADEPGWAAVMAYTLEGVAIGYAYANTIGPDDRWWKRMTVPVAPRFTDRDTVAVKEIGVTPAHRGVGLARRMHDALLDGRRERYATLMVNPAAGDGKVMRLYEGWGYREIGAVRPGAEAPWLVCMGRSVRM